ncbi:MAG TPA: ribonuclease HII [Proteiniclasticum sp.]|uniref:ribonuclease HII n=1 Tax=Proteiniclasticum sp. TaxID=2053595 RepID=UPI000E95CF90|nr:ribonuclease HII [Proteiniclasticum sp.]HBW12477.1 ribonuclease HII [Proteiniclasticum sp.]
MNKQEILKESAAAIKRYIKDHADLVLENREEWISALLEDHRKAVQGIGQSLKKSKEAEEKEILRVKALYQHDLSYGKIVCGVDEVGRGPLAGPIVAAAVILPMDDSFTEMILGIDDSKKISKKNREILAEMIKEKALSYSVYEMSNLDIDRLGISYCNHEVFRGAVRTLSVNPELVLSDGYKIKDYQGENIALVKGDTISASIACASIIAKVHRDRLMENYALYYPQYGFEHNAGYGSKDHLEALQEIGATPIHRISFLSNILK